VFPHNALLSLLTRRFVFPRQR